MKTKSNDSTAKPANPQTSTRQTDYFEWLRKKFPEDIQKMDKIAFMEKLAALRQKKD
jgi:membrane-bound lytic murein transglycosylase MltF